MQRFTRKNGRIPVKSEVDREVERRELATTVHSLLPIASRDVVQIGRFFPASHTIYHHTSYSVLGIPHAFKTSTSGAVRSVLNSQFTIHNSQFTTHNSRLYIGGHVFRDETAYTLMTMFVQRIGTSTCSKQAGDIGCRQPQAGHEIPYMYYRLQVGSSSTHMQVHVAVRISSPSPSFQHLRLAHPIIARKIRPVRTHGQSTVHPQARIHMAVPNPAPYQRVNSTTTLPTKQIPPPNNCSSP